MKQKRWDKPRSRNVGLFIDLSLYLEALRISAERGLITPSHLRQELSQRTWGQIFVEKQSSRTANDLVRELYEFGWLKRKSTESQTAEGAQYILTPAGQRILQLPSERDVRRQLAIEMQKRFTIPGWFVQRLWQINPSGKGEVILPSPPKDWRPASRNWEEKGWSDDLSANALAGAVSAQNVLPGSFPIDPQDWIFAVNKAWKHLGTWEQKRKADASGERVMKFSPRSRLTLAMRSAAIELLFGTVPPGMKEPDIWSNRAPILPRTFRVWCPRLLDLEFIFYSDRHPDITGRMLFPTAVFRQDAPQAKFEELSAIRDPSENPLWLYQPSWDDAKQQFMQTLVYTHRAMSRRVGTLYVSLLDVRDEVCRLLRLSAALFDKFLARAFRESLRLGASPSISIETDIREDQRTGSGLARRPVWVDDIPYSLIAIGKTDTAF